MIRSAGLSHDGLDLVPVAIVGSPLAAALGDRAKIVRGWDDLDWYDGADFLVDRDIPVSLRHYDGHPPETFTIYVDRAGLSDTGALALVLRELGIAHSALTWVRQAGDAMPDTLSGDVGNPRPRRSVA